MPHSLYERKQHILPYQGPYASICHRPKLVIEVVAAKRNLRGLLASTTSILCENRHLIWGSDPVYGSDGWTAENAGSKIEGRAALRILEAYCPTLGGFSPGISSSDPCNMCPYSSHKGPRLVFCRVWET